MGPVEGDGARRGRRPAGAPQPARDLTCRFWSGFGGSGILQGAVLVSRVPRFGVWGNWQPDWFWSS